MKDKILDNRGAKRGYSFLRKEVKKLMRLKENIENPIINCLTPFYPVPAHFTGKGRTAYSQTLGCYSSGPAIF